MPSGSVPTRRRRNVVISPGGRLDSQTGSNRISGGDCVRGLLSGSESVRTESACECEHGFRTEFRQRPERRLGRNCDRHEKRFEFSEEWGLPDHGLSKMQRPGVRVRQQRRAVHSEVWGERKSVSTPRVHAVAQDFVLYSDSQFARSPGRPMDLRLQSPEPVISYIISHAIAR